MSLHTDQAIPRTSPWARSLLARTPLPRLVACAARAVIAHDMGLDAEADGKFDSPHSSAGSEMCALHSSAYRLSMVSPSDVSVVRSMHLCH